MMLQAVAATPVTVNTAHMELIQNICHTFNVLAAQGDLSPQNATMNTTLSKYVGDIIAYDEIISDKALILEDRSVREILRPLRDILSRAEFEMETYFARDFASAAKLDIKDLNRFWYRENYKNLVRLELSTEHDVSQREGLSDYDQRPMAFIGSGPLPFSALDYFLETGRRCDCFEMNPVAAQQSRAIIANLGLEDNIRILHQDGAQADYSPYGTIFVAALVDNKDAVLRKVRETSQNAIIGIRSAEGLKELLYAPVDIKAVESQGYKYCDTSHGTREAVNSTCFFTKASI